MADLRTPHCSTGKFLNSIKPLPLISSARTEERKGERVGRGKNWSICEVSIGRGEGWRVMRIASKGEMGEGRDGGLCGLQVKEKRGRKEAKERGQRNLGNVSQ